MDDNARALMVAIRAHRLLGRSDLLDYIRHYLAFVETSQTADGRFHNFLSSDGTWLDDAGSEDCQGRAVWALGFAAARSAQSEVRVRALACLDRAFPALAHLTYLRSVAFASLGLSYWRQAEPSARLDDLSARFTSMLRGAYDAGADPTWQWFENELTYCNAALPEALLDGPARDAGLSSLSWLCQVSQRDGCLSLVGNDGWYVRGGQPAAYDQQPVDAGHLVSACTRAFQVTGDQRYRRLAELSYQWFLGKNIENRPMIDSDTGGCYDGLKPGGVNQNQGAESLLAWLSAQEDMLEMGWE